MEVPNLEIPNSKLVFLLIWNLVLVIWNLDGICRLSFGIYYLPFAFFNEKSLAMCTVTFIPKSDNSFILTSNRDEAPGRETFPPKEYKEEGVKLLYPKDAVAGGTWIGISEESRVVTLMNGGFKPHKRKSNYRRSRGLVVKDFLIAEDFPLFLETYNFNEIESFTAIVVEWKEAIKLLKVVWDGARLHILSQPITPHIWSSSPLYPEDLRDKREKWFYRFLEENNEISPENILRFHKNGGEGNPYSDLIIDRGEVRTKSITQIIKQGKLLEMVYEDLEKGKKANTSFLQ